MEGLIIREAVMADLPVLLRFEQGVINAERPFDSTLKRDDTHYYDIEEMIKAPHIHLVVAELNGDIIASGYARIEKAKHFVQHPQHSYLGFMYVEPQHRGKGINKEIMDELKAWSLLNNITEIRLEVYSKNIPAITAYEKVGFEQLMIEMRMHLTDK